MTPDERIAKAHRAQAALDEFVVPLLAETRDVYAKRIVEIASTELNRDARTDKVTALSTAIRVLDQLEDGLKAHMLDGQMALKDKLRTERVERLSPSQRRLLGLVPLA